MVWVCWEVTKVLCKAWEKTKVQNRICKLIAEENQITDQKEISSNKIVLNKKHFKQNSSNNDVQNQELPDSLNTKV